MCPTAFFFVHRRQRATHCFLEIGFSIFGQALTKGFREMVDIAGQLADIIQKQVELETWPYLDVQTLRLATQAAFWDDPQLRENITNLFMSYMTKDHTYLRNDIARRMLDHYINGKGADFHLSVADCTTLADGQVVNPDRFRQQKPLSIIYKRPRDAKRNNPTVDWSFGVAVVRAANSVQMPYKGKVFWNHDNGMINNYRVDFAGEIGYGIPPSAPPSETRKCIHWKGWVFFSDKCDFDPDWNWQPGKRRGKGGERRTRIMYILNLGWDFRVVGPMLLAEHRADQFPGMIPKTWVFDEVFTPSAYFKGGKLSWQ